MTTRYYSTRQRIAQFLAPIERLFFPQGCVICQNEISDERQWICLFCEQSLPFLHLSENGQENLMAQLFWGRVPVKNAFALLSYTKLNATQTILNRIKYKDKPEMAFYMGAFMGKQLKSMEWIKDIDALVPIPIHPKKKFIRGYNQSERLAQGLSEVLNIPLKEDLLQKHLHTISQTQKGRFARWDNLAGAFLARTTVQNAQHIALVDDVVTTGATLERILQELKENNPEIRVSVITLALAQ